MEHGHVLAKVPLSRIIPHTPISNLRCIASVHNVTVRREIQGDRDGLIECFKDHHCPNCNSHLSVFSVVYKKPNLKSSDRPVCAFSAGGSQRKSSL